MVKGSDDRVEEVVWPETVVGGKYVRLLDKVLTQLRQDDAHGNRKLHLDAVFVVHLLAFFNPTVRSLRTIEDFSQTRQVRKHVSLRKVCRSTLSDFHQIAEPGRLVPIITELRRQLNRKNVTVPNCDNADLCELLKQTIAVDGTFLPALADVAWAVRNANSHGTQSYRARLDVHLDVATWLPEAIVVPEPGQSETDSAIENIREGRIHLYDRAFSSFALLNAHYRQDDDEWVPRSHFVVRYRPAGGNSPELRETKSRELTEADRQAGVISDCTGVFHSSKPNRHKLNAVPLREVCVQVDSDGETKTLRLITNLFDVPASVIAQLYQWRWQVELFFRWLKCFGNFTHLISHSRDGVLMHFHVTIIAALLMYLHTGYRPSKYLFVLLSQVATGAATLDEVIPILRERERQSHLARESAARRRAKKHDA